jgi:hypothetical protein
VPSSMASSPGRWSRPLAPLMPASRKIPCKSISDRPCRSEGCQPAQVRRGDGVGH